MIFSVLAVLVAVALIVVAVALFRSGGSRVLPVILVILAVLVAVTALSLDTSTNFGPVNSGAGVTQG